MSREWKPGDVALVERPSGGEVAAVLIGHDPGQRCWHSADRMGDLNCLASEAVAARPLVVIDPEDEDTVNRVADAIRNHHRKDSGVWTGNDWLNVRAALRSLNTPPKPDEPTGLGAVVEDDEGHHWVRSDASGMPWVSRFGGNLNQKRWATIAAVKVLSEGVTQ